MAAARRSCGVDDAASWRRRSCSTSIFRRREELRCSGRGGGNVGSSAIDSARIAQPFWFHRTSSAHTGSKHHGLRPLAIATGRWWRGLSRFGKVPRRAVHDSAAVSAILSRAYVVPDGSHRRGRRTRIRSSKTDLLRQPSPCWRRRTAEPRSMRARPA